MAYVLVACEYSGVVRDAFREAGHHALSCDLLPTENPEMSRYHFVGDVREILEAYSWDLIIAHPPCTYLANSGVRHLHTDPTRWHHLTDAVEFFNLFKGRAPRVCIENPIPHKHARSFIGDYTQIIQPWMFGHPESKATCLWLENLPPLQPTHNVKDEMLRLPASERNRIHYMSPGPDRGKLRSRTYEGIARAMAEQWGPLLEEDVRERTP